MKRCLTDFLVRTLWPAPNMFFVFFRNVGFPSMGAMRTLRWRVLDLGPLISRGSQTGFLYNPTSNRPLYWVALLEVLNFMLA